MQLYHAVWDNDIRIPLIESPLFSEYLWRLCFDRVLHPGFKKHSWSINWKRTLYWAEAWAWGGETLYIGTWKDVIDLKFRNRDQVDDTAGDVLVWSFEVDFDAVKIVIGAISFRY